MLHLDATTLTLDATSYTTALAATGCIQCASGRYYTGGASSSEAAACGGRCPGGSAALQNASAASLVAACGVCPAGFFSNATVLPSILQTLLQSSQVMLLMLLMLEMLLMPQTETGDLVLLPGLPLGVLRFRQGVDCTEPR